MPGPRGVPRGDTPGTATAAGGTHPTGMHSCLDYVLTIKIKFRKKLTKRYQGLELPCVREIYEIV